MTDFNTRTIDMDPSVLADMADYIKESYRAVVEVDELLHAWRDRLRTRLHAFRLATDPDFLQSIRDAEAKIDAGTAKEDFFTAADL